jgi:hypothetical protein
MNIIIKTKVLIALLFVAQFLLAEISYAQLKIPKIIFEHIDSDKPQKKYRLIVDRYFRINNVIKNANEEFIAFYYWDIDDKDWIKSRWFYEKVKIYEIKNNNIIKSYSIYDERPATNLNNIEESIIKSIESVIGKWNGCFYSYDLNKNGFNEIILFPRKAGGHLTMAIYEFRKDRFICLTPNSFDMDRLDEISVDINNSSFTIKIPYEFEEHKEGHREKTYKWNQKKQVYELVRNVHVEVLKKK